MLREWNEPERRNARRDEEDCPPTPRLWRTCLLARRSFSEGGWLFDIVNRKSVVTHVIALIRPPRTRIAPSSGARRYLTRTRRRQASRILAQQTHVAETQQVLRWLVSCLTRRGQSTPSALLFPCYLQGRIASEGCCTRRGCSTLSLERGRVRGQYSPPVPVRTARSTSGETPTWRPSASVTPTTE
jgi:hypothetical protein